MTTALVTGATSGIGAGFAERLARLGHDLVIVARDETRLRDTADRLHTTHRITLERLPADLATDAGCTAVEERLTDEGQPIDVLVNNAGFSLGTSFLTSSADDEERMLRVMVRAPMRLAHAALPGMVARRRGAVINVSSMAGFVPVNTYGAAKAWVTAFSQALHAEVSGTGVRVMAVCPGYTHTEFHARAGISERSIPRALWLDVDNVVDTALRDLRRGRELSVASRRYQAARLGARLVPHRFAARVSRGMRPPGI